MGNTIDIANPIYDVVFKYLMEDKKIAIYIISTITGLEIEDLDLRPTETSLAHGAGRNFTVYRLDFAAKVKSAEGNRVVLVEIQKAKFYTDIQRFRKYLGTQYASDENLEDCPAPNGVVRKKALPIYSIYILGHWLENIHCPVIQVKRAYFDAATGEELKQKEEFIESLTHDSTVIQIPGLKNQRRNRLEVMLGIFDQAYIDQQTRQILHIRVEDFPPEMQPIIRRLLTAIADNELRKQMAVEDEMVSELETRDRAINSLGEVARKAQEETLEERRQKEEERRQKEEERRQKEEERRQKEEALAKLEAAVEALVSSGKTRAQARRMLGL